MTYLAYILPFLYLVAVASAQQSLHSFIFQENVLIYLFYIGTVLRCPKEVTTLEHMGNINITCTRRLDVDVRSEIQVLSQPKDPPEATGYFYLVTVVVKVQYIILTQNFFFRTNRLHSY